MITCPWCGTSYQTFQPNCSNCGGVMPRESNPYGIPPAQAGSPAPLIPPPPAPRTISNNYAWKLVFQQADGIVGAVFLIIGTIFGCVSIILVLAIITVPIGLIFLLVGGLMFLLGIGLFVQRYQKALKVVNVLQVGEAVPGEVIACVQNFSVRINHRYPWIISYRFQVHGQSYTGTVTTLDQPGLVSGQPVYVLYLPDSPANNSIYPHP